MRKIRVGTRGSNLALWQANFVKAILEKQNPGVLFELVIIKTEGDLDQRSSLTQIGGQGIFTKELEKALLNNTIDIAVHSLKDLPSSMPEELMLGAVPERGPVEDVLVTEKGLSLDQLPEDARIATGSIRRKSQLLNLRPDLILTDLRGNIDTRIRKLREQDLDGIIMARAALIRLELDRIQYVAFSTRDMLPAVGQGAIGIQVRKEDREVTDIIQPVNHYETFQAVSAEREMLYTLDSGCQFPVGSYAHVSDGQLEIKGFVGSEDGGQILYEQVKMDARDPRSAGKLLAETLIAKGAQSILKEFLKAQ